MAKLKKETQEKLRTRARAAMPQAYEKFGEVAERLADAMAATFVHYQCPEYLRQRIAELHKGLMSEFNCDVEDDIRLRFALGAAKAAEAKRPAD